MPDITRPETRDVGGVLVTMMGMVLAVGLALWFTVEARPARDQAEVQRPVDQDKAEVDAARTRAMEWATPECRNRVGRAVARANTERAVADAAWAACPDHPDALE